MIDISDASLALFYWRYNGLSDELEHIHEDLVSELDCAEHSSFRLMIKSSFMVRDGLSEATKAKLEELKEASSLQRPLPLWYILDQDSDEHHELVIEKFI